MKRSIFLIACLAALALGFALGSSNTPSETRPVPQSTEHTPHPQAEATPEIGSMPAGLGNDERIVRVFSALKERVDLRKKYALFEALQDLTAADMAALVKHVQSLSKAASNELLPALIERWFELDVAGATTWISKAELDGDLVQLWAKADPEGALRFASGSPDGVWSSNLANYALTALYKEDYAAILARAQTFGDAGLRTAAVSNLLQTWVKVDPAAAIAAFEAMPAKTVPGEFLRYLLQIAAIKAPDVALAKLNELLPTLKAGLLGNDLIGSVAKNIARNDPKKALEWLSGLPGEFREPALIPVGKRWAAKEPLGALEWSIANGVDITRADWNGPSSWQSSMLGVFMEKAYAETFATLEALPAGAQRDSLLEAAFMESLWHTPPKELFANGDAMARGFYDKLPPDAQSAKAYLFGQKRAEFGALADVGAWAQSFPPGSTRSNAIAGAMFATQQKNATSAEEQFAKLTTPSDRDAALRGMATAQSGLKAADRALAIADPTIRRDTLEEVFPRWQKTDAEASRAWLESANVPEEWRRELRQQQ
jgi:hypothetical protein